MRLHMRSISAALGCIVLLSSCAKTELGMNPESITNPVTPVAITPGIVSIPVKDRVNIGRLSGKTLSGQKYSLTKSSNLMVINVWASWCTNCRLEWKDLQAAALRNPEVIFLGINASDKRADAKAFIKKHGDNYQHIFDPDLIAFGSMRGVSSASIPMTLILDRSQRVAAQILGKVKIADLTNLLKSLGKEN